MLIVHDAYGSSDLPQGAVATIGNFDGVHKGQREVIAAVVERARALSAPSMVITFEPHPLTVLRPDEAPLRLTTPKQKIQLLESTGIDVLLVLKFDTELASVTAEEFARGFLHDLLSLNALYVGASFRFGHDRQGSVAMLREMEGRLGLQAVGIEEVVRRGERISSTRIRRALAEGRVEDAMEMLGRPHTITGVVVRGDQMGKRLGWPTANLAPDNEQLPADGVYAAQAHFPNLPTTFNCSTNVGTRPTVYENYQRVVESHILDFSTDVYGERVEISFYKKLREERIFPTVMDLSAQIGRDVETTREYFAARRALARPVDGGGSKSDRG